MKRKKFVFAIIVICIIAIAGVFFNEKYYSWPKKRTEFLAYETAFESLKDFILSVDLDLQDDERKFYLIVQDESGTIIELYDFPIELEKEDLDLLNYIRGMYVQDFHAITVTNKRISFQGSGSEMVVYSIDDKRPTYFYHEDDGIHFTVTKLLKHWYFLYIQTFYLF